MRTKAIEIITALVLGILIPSLLVAALRDKVFPHSGNENYADPTRTDVVLSSGIIISDEDGTLSKMPLEDYVLSVVLREMPAGFEIEALKAQAVVARTYALRRVQSGGKHGNAAVCTMPSCCQGVCTPDEYLKSGGTQESIDKVKEAVEATAGLVLVYKNELIDATYFSCSGGSTEDAQAVWGTDVPYLQSVKSPGEEEAKHYVDTVEFSSYEFLSRLGFADCREKKVTIGQIVYTDGDGIDIIDICGTQFSGVELRKLLGLRSTSFLISAVGDTVTITTKGFGHRVGMSQYGADAMAANGASFQEILLHYYQGVELIPFDFD